jgi:predicted heme/steroid binding protein
MKYDGIINDRKVGAAMRKTHLMFIVITITLLITTALFACTPKKLDIYIFEKISECDNINGDVHTNAKVTVYDNSDKDKNLKGLSYSSFFAGEYLSNELDFKIFAYEFENTENAKKYFENATGKKNVNDTTFSMSKGMFEYMIIVIDNKNAYCAYTSPSNDEALETFLAEVFSKKLDL